MLIGISGKKQSGKDTSYRIIKQLCMFSPHHVVQYAFADGVKEFAQEYFGIDRCEEDKESVRFIWQGIGQLMREEVDKEYWIKREVDAYEEHKAKHWAPDWFIGVIADVRYKNEAEYLMSHNYPVVRVVRENSDSEDSHPSEVELDSVEFDYKIYNTGDLDHLEEQWKQLLPQILS